MAKTALQLTPEELKAYHTGQRLKDSQDIERRERAWEVARAAADLLREEYGATRVLVFGSLAHGAWFTPWSDIDLAAWGIPSDRFYSAMADVTELSSEFKIDLVDPETCRPTLREEIEREGVEL